ncbi:ABC transporter transmembrane domain-containing protein [Nocardioides pacificus]
MSAHEQLPRTPGALIRRLLRREWRAVTVSVVLVTVWQVAELMVPGLIAVFIERAVVTGDARELAWWSAVLAVHFVVLSLSYRFGARAGLRALQAQAHALRCEISARVLSPRGLRTDRLSGDVLTIATTDAEMVATVIRQLTFTVAGGVGLIVSAVVLAAIDLVLAGLVLVGVPVVLGVTQALSPRLSRRSEVRQEALGTAAGIAGDFVQGLRPLKGIGAEDAAMTRYRVESRQAARASVGAAWWEGLMHAMTAGLSGVFLAVVAVVAGVRAVEGDIGVGEFVAVVGISQFLAEPMRTLTYLVAQLAQSRASAARVVSLLASGPLVVALAEEGKGGEASAGGGVPALELRGVRHGPLVDLRLRVEPGCWVALVVEDPAEAAALLALLRGEARPVAGEVLVGGTPLGRLGPDRHRAALLVSDHHVDLFSGGVLDNVDPAAALDDAALARVLVASAADEVVAQVPVTDPDADGEDPRIGALPLSGGQRQRVGLARALAADPPVLVLHDPTTAVDAVTEARIADGLRQLRHGTPACTGSGDPRTTLTLTSSPALLARADVVLRVQGGRVVAQGTHAALLGDDDYRRLVLR